MSRVYLILPILFMMLIPLCPVADAADIRQAAEQARRDREAILDAAREAQTLITTDREALSVAVDSLEAVVAAMETELNALAAARERALTQKADLSEQWSRRELDFKEITGNVRIAARDLEGLVRNSLVSAADGERIAILAPILEKSRFPSLDDISNLAALYFDEIVRSGEVDLDRSGRFINRAGDEVTGHVLRLGTFTSVYQTDSETGYLKFLPGESKLVALPALPARSVSRNLKRYLQGESESVTLDLSGGAALRQLTGKASLLEQIRAGGPLVWPILLIALISIGIVIERVIYLNKVHSNADRIMSGVSAHAARRDWGACEAVLREPQNRHSPVVNVIRAGLSSRREKRESLESVLQEAILRELPRLEHFLTALSVIGAVAPLLGLLGTVTGMIDTFRVITLHGTGDPKLMSGGISEALITTELGLAVAIPVLLLHTFLSRRVEHLVGEMEEKALALTNIILKENPGNGSDQPRS